MCSSSMGPKVEWGVHHILLCCTCFYKWISAARPSGRAWSHPPGTYNPREALAVQGVFHKWWRVASHLCDVAPKQQPLGHLCWWRQERHGLRHRHSQGYIWWWDSDPGSRSRLVWWGFHRALFREHHWPECVEHVFGSKTYSFFEFLLTSNSGKAFHLEPWAHKQSHHGQKGAGPSVLSW